MEIIAAASVSSPLWSQQSTHLPRPEDVSTLDGIIRAYYEVVCGAAGVARDTERDASLHHPDARAIITGVDADGNPTIQNLTLAEYHERTRAAGNPAFWEHEIFRVTQRFGNVAHVWSTYAWYDSETGPIKGRGINSIQLYFDGVRWWITAWIYDSERPDNPIPPAFLPPGR
jgi:hypothetical protein